MVKKCYNCGTTDNPDNANFCGKCGKKLSLLDNWKLYNASYYCLLTKSEYDKYKQLKEKCDKTFFQRIKNWFSANLHIFKGIGYSGGCLFFLCLSFIMIPQTFKDDPWYEATFYCISLVFMIIVCGCGAYFSFKNEDF